MPLVAAMPQLYTIPNLVTLLRLPATLLFVLLSARAQSPEAAGARWGSLLLFAGIASSDMLDGWLARRFEQSSALGRILDHVSDVVFILTALSAFVARGLVPWWFPVAIAWAFALYVLDSWWRTAGQAQRRLLSSRFGHLGGMLYYLTVGLVTLQVCTEGRWLSAHLLHLWYLALTTLALLSGVERLWLLVCACRRAAPGSPPPEPPARTHA